MDPFQVLDGVDWENLCHHFFNNLQIVHVLRQQDLREGRQGVMGSMGVIKVVRGAAQMA